MSDRSTAFRKLCTELTGVTDEDLSRTGSSLLLLLTLKLEDVEVFKLLVKNPDIARSIDRPNAGGETPLMLAVRYLACDKASALVKAKADVGARNNVGETPLSLACDGNTVALSILVQSPTFVNASAVLKANGETYLTAALRTSNVSLTDVLLRHRADPNLRTRDGTAPIEALVGMGRSGDPDRDLSLLRMLISAKADVQRHDQDGRTLLHVAAEDGRHVDYVKALLDAGASPWVTDGNGMTSFSVSAARRDVEVLVAMLAKPGRGSRTGIAQHADLLTFALSSEELLPLALAMLRAGADPTQATAGDRALRLITTRLREPLSVRLLAEVQCDKASLSHELADVISNGRVDTLRALLHAGADPNVPEITATKKSCLMMACSHARAPELVSTLLEAKADAGSLDLDGNDAIHYATRAGRAEVLAMLTAAGAAAREVKRRRVGDNNEEEEKRTCKNK